MFCIQAVVGVLLVEPRRTRGLGRAGGGAREDERRVPPLVQGKAWARPGAPLSALARSGPGRAQCVLAGRPGCPYGVLRSSRRFVSPSEKVQKQAKVQVRPARFSGWAAPAHPRLLFEYSALVRSGGLKGGALSRPAWLLFRASTLQGTDYGTCTVRIVGWLKTKEWVQTMPSFQDAVRRVL